jgi:putative toxin-antitoxin system antitoxin component (TIGR02293 family)
LNTEGRTFTWSSRLERVDVIREGIPNSSLEVISKKIKTPIKNVLDLVGIPQTTYNKKKANHALLGSRDSELVLRISELIDLDLEVFNEEEDKFHRLLNKPNISLGGISPIKLLDTNTGINEVQSCLNKIEYGNFA